MARFDGKYSCLYPHYTREQLKPEYRQKPAGNIDTIKGVVVINFNGVVFHSFQSPCMRTSEVSQIQRGLAIFSDVRLSNANGEGEILALFEGIDYKAYAKAASEVCSRWHVPRSIIGELEKELLISR